MQISLMLPLVPAHPDQAVPYARMVQEHSGLTRLWQGQSYGVESSATFSHLAGAGYRVPVGLAVLVSPLRHPSQAALEARSLAVVSGSSPVVGYGPGSAAVQERLLGRRYPSPVRASEQFLLGVKEALARLEPSDLAEPWPADGQRVENEPLPFVPGPRVQLGLGVLRVPMARAAGRVADAAITWITPAPYLRETIAPAMAEAAADRGRQRPHLVALVPLALERPGRHALELCHLSMGGHLEGPHYAAMLQQAGAGADTADLGERLHAAVAGGAFLYGTAEHLAAQLRDYEDAGVDEVVVNLRATRDLYGDDETCVDLSELLGVLGRAGRASVAG